MILKKHLFKNKALKTFRKSKNHSIEYNDLKYILSRKSENKTFKLKFLKINILIKNVFSILKKFEKCLIRK